MISSLLTNNVATPVMYEYLISHILKIRKRDEKKIFIPDAWQWLAFHPEYTDKSV